MKCVVMAAGYATRLYPLTENFPKPLLKVRGKAILDWLLDDIHALGLVDEFVIISNHRFARCFEEWKQERSLDGTGLGEMMTIVDDGTVSNESRLGAFSLRWTH